MMPARRLAISAIINELPKIKKNAEKAQWLEKHDSFQLRQVLRINYDDSIEFTIPDSRPPWKKNEYLDADSLFYQETRRLKIFIKGGGYENLNQVKKESLFISLLEDLDNNDAELLVQMLQKKPFKGLTKKALEEFIPNIYETKVV
jgi:hypothetical protein